MTKVSRSKRQDRTLLPIHSRSIAMSSSTSYIMSVPRRGQTTAKQMVRARQIVRCYASVPKPPTVGEPFSGDGGAPSKTLPSTPYTVKEPPVFPAPKDPFEQPSPAERAREQPKYSEGTKNFVMGLARLMGYNSAASTAIRETGRMMKGIVDSVEEDRSFWYGGEPFCRQSFDVKLTSRVRPGTNISDFLPNTPALPSHATPTLARTTGSGRTTVISHPRTSRAPAAGSDPHTS